MKTDIDQVEEIVGSQYSDVLIRIRLSHPLGGRQEFAFRSLGNGRLRLPIRLQRTRNERNIDETIALHVNEMSIGRMQPI